MRIELKIMSQHNYYMEKGNSKPQDKYMILLTSLEQVIFNLTEENIESATQQTLDLFDSSFPISFNFVIKNMVYKAINCGKNVIDIYLNYLKLIQTKETEMNENNPDIIKIFTDFLYGIRKNEAYTIIEKMIERKLIDGNITQLKSFYFMHHRKGITDEFLDILFNDPFQETKFFLDNYEELSKNDWKAHKKYLKEEHNPNEICKIIRNDEIEKLQEITSQTKFNIDQTIEPSLYEKCSFINKENTTLIDYAAFFGSIKCFKHLFLNGADPKNASKYAIAGGNLEIIHLCEQNHLSFEDAFKTAIKFHQNDIFHYLYENGLDTKSTCYLKYYCVQNENYEIFSFLGDEKIEDYVINESAKNGNLYLVKHLILNYKIPKNILVFSSKSGNIELVEYILKQGIDINARSLHGKTALMKASKYGYTEIVKLLLEQEEIDVNAEIKEDKVNTALMKATVSGNLEIVKLLLEHKGININAQDYEEETALIKAVKNNYLEIVKLLLEQEGTDVNIQNFMGWTALNYAVACNFYDEVEILLKHKIIDVNNKDRNRDTPLIRASKNGYFEMVELLLENGVDINAINNKGQTALICASENDKTDVVEVLVDQEEIDINIKDNDGRTALIYAVKNGNIEIVLLLLEQKGIDITTKDKYGGTALKFAEDYPEIKKLLLEKSEKSGN